MQIVKPSHKKFWFIQETYELIKWTERPLPDLQIECLSHNMSLKLRRLAIPTDPTLFNPPPAAKLNL